MFHIHFPPKLKLSNMRYKKRVLYQIGYQTLRFCSPKLPNYFFVQMGYQTLRFCSPRLLNYKNTTFMLLNLQKNVRSGYSDYTEKYEVYATSKFSNLIEQKKSLVT